MAPETWSNLPPDILSTISKILNSDVDILRLRSVCSSWRSSVPPRLRPSSFPLNVPPLWNCSSRTHCVGSRYLLNYSTFYRLSRPEHGPRAGDPSDGWLLRVLEVNPNRFSLLCQLVPDRVDFSPGTIPKYLNLLDYRITEICKCYNLKFVDPTGFTTDVLEPLVGKITVLRNYTVDCDFVVLVLFSNFTASYWKFGQKDWTPIDTKGYCISDVAVCKGKCYAITDKGVLFSFDSNMNLKVVHVPRLPMNHVKTVNYLVEYKSDLYVVERIYEIINSDDDDETSDEEDKNEVPFRCEVFKKCKTWKPIRCLGDAVFLSCEDVSVGFSAEDFRCCKGNSVYVAIAHFIPDSGVNHKVIYSGVHDLADGQTSYMKMIEDCTFMYWPPPMWLTSC